MAYSTVETKIANPAEIISLVLGNPSRKKRRKASMAKRKRRLSAKQIRFFGTPAQKAALKRKRRTNSGKRRHTKRRHMARTNPAPRKRRHSSHRRTHRKRSAPRRDVNLMLGNPARRKRRKHSMARSRKRKNAGSHSHRRSAKRTTRRRRFSSRRSNPAGLGRPMDWVKGGASVLGGVLVTRGLPQMVAATYNTGWTGYGLNAVAAIAAGWAAHSFTRDPVVTGGVLAGGFAAIIARMISDMTSFGSYLSLTGVGDYQFSNFVTPQRLNAWQNAQVQVPEGWNGTALPALNTQLYSSDSGSHC